eukprot:c6943_g1_i1.p1 GENE.c6943_g1_i1~~c6943_g1_i1.p1  ORF type:complete len:391 (+),score=75.08 c6943_g1_i1:66-1175(+)
MDKEAPQAFSFSAAGWLKMYYFGVALAILEAELHKNAAFAGASAGSLVAAASILELDILSIRDFALTCVERCHGSVVEAFRCHKMVEEIFEASLTKTSNIIEKLDGRLHVGVTTLPWVKSKLYTEFESIEKLRKILLASCCMTPIAGFPFQLDGEWIFDGGLSCFQPLVPNRKNITISPFYFSQADIKPSRYLPVWWAVYPPRVEDFEWVFDLGYNDAQDWIEHHTNAANRPTLRRQSSRLWPHRQSGSFERFFGYRSVLKVIPSTFFDMILLILVFLVIEPCVYGLIYVELGIHAWLHLVKAILCSFPLLNKQAVAMASRNTSVWCFKVLTDPRLVAKMVPGVGKFVEFNMKELRHVSTVFRFAMHML